MEDLLDDLFFYNCPRPKVICSDFAKGLMLAITRRKAERQWAGHEEIYIFQLFEWHMVEAIKRHLVVAGTYPKDLREKIIDLI